MIRKLIATDNDAAITVLRLVLGIVFFAHGAQKMLGWFGGYGFTGTMGFFTGMLHIPVGIRISGHCRRILRRTRPPLRPVHPRCRLWNLLQHARSRGNGPSSVRLLYELDWDAKGRRFRVPPSGTGDYGRFDDSRRRRSFRRSPVVFPCEEQHHGPGTAASRLIGHT